ncbi:MAG: hypothetical protein ACM3NQ_02255 [Bacteroidales bacterium]
MNTRVVRKALCALVLVLCGSTLLFAQDPPPPTPAPDYSGWRVDIYPVLAWLPIYGVDTTLPTPPGEPGCGCGGGTSGHASSNWNSAWFAAFRVEKGRFAVAADFNYAGLTAEKDTPFLKVNADFTTGAIAGGFRMVGPWYVEAGGRWHTANITASILKNPEVTWKPGGWEAVVGTTFRPQLAKRWRLFTHLDAGGFGGNGFSTVNGMARAEWRPLKHFALTMGYGFGTLRVNGEIASKPIHLSQTLHGPVVGLDIPF